MVAIIELASHQVPDTNADQAKTGCSPKQIRRSGLKNWANSDGVTPLTRDRGGELNASTLAYEKTE